MKKSKILSLITLLVLTTWVFSPTLTSAQTPTESLILQLQQQIKALQEQITSVFQKSAETTQQKMARDLGFG